MRGRDSTTGQMRSTANCCLERALFGNNRVAVFVGGCTAAEEAECAGPRVPKLVFLPRANGDGVAGGHSAQFSFDPDLAYPMSDVINLLSLPVIVFSSG